TFEKSLSFLYLIEPSCTTSTSRTGWFIRSSRRLHVSLTKSKRYDKIGRLTTSLGHRLNGTVWSSATKNASILTGPTALPSIGMIFGRKKSDFHSASMVGAES
ncbi:unnamed protein product, partial [Aphanomyces euteiches]